MLETSDLAQKYTPICSFRKYTFQCLGPLIFADVSFFLQKINVFCSKKYLYSKQQCECSFRHFLVLLSVFVRKKVTITKNISFADSVPESGHRTAPNWPKIRKMTMTSHFPDMTSKSFFLRCFVFLVKFSYWSKFHVNIITGSGIMTIFFYKEFTRNPENRKYPRLSFAQYLETGAKYGYRTLHECL